MKKKFVRIEIIREEEGSGERELFSLSGEKAHQQVYRLSDANSYASIDDMLKEFEKFPVAKNAEFKGW